MNLATLVVTGFHNSEHGGTKVPFIVLHIPFHSFKMVESYHRENIIDQDKRSGGGKATRSFTDPT